MAQWDLLLTQNVHATLIEYEELFVNIGKGDLLSAIADQTPTVLPAGTDGYVLVRDDIEVTGLKWIAQSALEGVSVTNQANDRVVTATAVTDELNAEQYLTYNTTQGLGIGAGLGIVFAATTTTYRIYSPDSIYRTNIEIFTGDNSAGAAGDLTLGAGSGTSSGGNVYFNRDTTYGNFYFGTGGAGQLPAAGAETNVVYYDPTTGKISYASQSAGMVYPSAGIAVSTGSAWASSITDNHTEWDTAYSHSQLTSGNPHAVTFLELGDTPSAYTASGGYMVMVNSTPDGLEFIDPSGYNLSNFSNDLSLSDFSNDFGDLTDLTNGGIADFTYNGSAAATVALDFTNLTNETTLADADEFAFNDDGVGMRALTYSALKTALEADITIPVDFTDLGDTPSSYSGAGGYLVMVNSTPDGLEFVDPSGYNLSSFNDDLGYTAYTFDDGLTETTGSVNLGGSYANDISLTTVDHAFSIFAQTTSSPVAIGIVTGLSASTSTDTALVGVAGIPSSTVVAQIGVQDGSSNFAGITIGWTGSVASMLVEDSVESKGLYYNADYSVGATDRWIPDKAYVDSVAGGSSTFIGLTDTPSSYTSSGGFMVMVNSTPNGLEFVDPSTYGLSNFDNDIGLGGVAWGTATSEYIVLGSSPGDIESSADLQYNTSTYTLQIGFTNQDAVIQGLDGSSSTGSGLTVRAGDSGGTTYGGGDLILKSGDGAFGASGSPGRIYLVPGDPVGAGGVNYIHIGDSSFIGGAVRISALGTEDDITIYLEPKGIGGLNLGATTTATTNVYGTNSIALYTNILYLGEINDQPANLRTRAGTVSSPDGGYLQIQTGIGYAPGNGDGGDIYFDTGAGGGSGVKGGIYFSNYYHTLAIANNEAETNLVAIDTTTGLLSYRSVASIGGGGISWGTATNEYIVLGSASGDIESSAALAYDTATYTMSMGTSGNNSYIVSADGSTAVGTSLVIKAGAGDTGYTGGNLTLSTGDSDSTAYTELVFIPGRNNAGSSARTYFGSNASTEIQHYIYARANNGTGDCSFVFTPQNNGYFQVGYYSYGGYASIYGLIINPEGSYNLQLSRANANIDYIELTGGLATAAAAAGEIRITGGGGGSVYGDGGDVIIYGGYGYQVSGDHDGGNVYIYGGFAGGVGVDGSIYFGTGAAGALSENASATELVTYNTTTGLLEYIQTSSLGGGSVSFGTAQYQIPFTNSGLDDFDYSAGFTFDDSTDTLTVGEKTATASSSYIVAPDGDVTYVDGGDLYIQAGDPYNTAGADAGDLFIRAGDARWGDSLSAAGALYLSSGSAYDTIYSVAIYLGSPTYANNAISLESYGTETNIGINIRPKGTGTLSLGRTTTGYLYMYATGRIHLNSPVVRFTTNATCYIEGTQGGSAHYDGYDIVVRGGTSYASADGDGGAVTITGGAARVVGNGDGGDVFIYGGIGYGTGVRGSVYMGDGSANIYLPNDEAETNLVAIDATTGLLSYRSVASIGGGDPFPYIVDDATTSTSIEIAEFRRTSSSTPAAGIGGYLTLGVEGADSSITNLRIHHILSAAGTGAEDSVFLMTGGYLGSVDNDMLFINNGGTSYGGRGGYTVALGYSADVPSNYDISIGWDAGHANTAQNSINIGYRSGNTSGTIHTSGSTISIGFNCNQGTHNLGYSSIAIGGSARTVEDNMVSIGTNSGTTSGTVGQNAVSIGPQTNSGSYALGGYSIAIGDYAKSSSFGAIAIGRSVYAAATGAIIMGYHTSEQSNTVARSFKLMWDATESFLLKKSASATTGDEVCMSYTPVVDKATSGIYTAFLINVTDTSSPETTNYLLDLQVDSTTKFRVDDSGGITDQLLLSSYGGGTYTGTAAYNLEVDSSGNVIETTAGSDARFKENVQVIADPMAIINNLRGYVFNYNELGQKITGRDDSRRVGFIAQEVLDIFPEAVKLIGNTEYYKVEYDYIIPLLTEGIKHLEKRIQELEIEVETLKN